MQNDFLYQQPLENVGTKSDAPHWSWPVLLSDGRLLLTLLYQKPASPPRTQILELSPDGHAKPWPPALGYPAPVIFYATPNNQLIGLDLIKTGKIYACLPDGTHLWSLPSSPRMDTPIAPRTFHQIDNQLHWIEQNETPAAADITTGTPLKILIEQNQFRIGDQIHFPHTHTTAEDLFILDFDPTARITRYKNSPRTYD